MEEKEMYASLLAKRAETAVKVIKSLVIAAFSVAVALVIYGIIAVTAIEDTKAALIGFIVIISIVAALFAAVVAAYIYAKINLIKLKKLH